MTWSTVRRIHLLVLAVIPACSASPNAGTDVLEHDDSEVADFVVSDSDGDDLVSVDDAADHDDGALTDGGPEDGCPEPGPPPPCPGGSDSHVAMSPADRVVLARSRVASAATLEEVAFSCDGDGVCMLLGLRGTGPLCWIRALDEPPTVDCESFDWASMLGTGVRCDWFGAVGSATGRFGALLGCVLDSSGSRSGWLGLCVPQSGSPSVAELDVGGHPDSGAFELLFGGHLLDVADSFRVFGPVGESGDFRWADAGWCAGELGGAGVVASWPSMILQNPDYHVAGWQDRAGVGHYANRVVMTALLDTREVVDPRDRFVVVFADLDGGLLGSPSYLSLSSSDTDVAVDWNPRVAVLGDGTAVVAVRRLGRFMDGDLSGARALASVRAGATTERTFFRTWTYEAGVFDPVALSDRKFALLWRDYWGYGTADAPVCTSACRPLTILVGLDGHDVEAPAENTLCLSNGGCVVDARAEFVAGRLIVVWVEADATVNLVVLDLAEYGT